MTLFELKDKYQREALNHWATNGFKGTLEIATGVGKTRCAVLAVEWMFKKFKNPKILILTPTEIIRDKVFPDEFRKWKLGHLLDKIEIQCIQSAYKRANEQFDLVVADEVHNYLAEHYSLFFENRCDKILGLSASIYKERLEIIQKIAPICYTIDTDRAVELGLVSPYIEYNIAIEMMEEEKVQLDLIQTDYAYYEEYFGGPFEAYTKARDIIKKARTYKTKEEWDEYKKARAFWKCMQDRKQFIYNCKSKVKAVHDLIDKLNLDHTMIFSQSTKFADAISEGRPDILPFHTNLKTSKEMDFNMSKFLDGRTKVKHLSTCKCTEEGMDLPKLPVIINASRTSSAKAHIQKRGRCLRFEEGKASYIFNLYVEGSQDRKWLRSAQETTNYKNIIWVKSIDEIKI